MTKKKKRNKQDATLININALKKRIQDLESKVGAHKKAICDLLTAVFG